MVVNDCEPEYLLHGAATMCRILNDDGELGAQLVYCCSPDSARHKNCLPLGHEKWFVPEHVVWFTEAFLDRIRQNENPAEGWSHSPESEWSGEVVKYDDPNDGKRYAWKLVDAYGGPEYYETFWRMAVWA